MKKFFLIILITFAIVACEDTSYQKVQIDDKFSLSLPGYLSEANGLNDEASLQYQNLIKEFYTIVIDENIETFNNAIIDNELQEVYSTDLDGYYSLLIDTFSEGIDVFSKSDPENITINGMPAKFVEIEGAVDNVNIYYHYTIVKGEKDYYQILSWTLRDRKVNYNEQMGEVANSFVEI